MDHPPVRIITGFFGVDPIISLSPYTPSLSGLPDIFLFFFTIMTLANLIDRMVTIKSDNKTFGLHCFTFVVLSSQEVIVWLHLQKTRISTCE